MQAPVRRHLFYLGGVPRWVFEYIFALMAIVRNRQSKIPTVEEAENAFKQIKGRYVNEWGKTLDSLDFVTLCAYSISGKGVDLSDKDIGGMKWSRVRDSSLCIISDSLEVLIPYAIVHRVASFSVSNFEADAIKCFIICVQGLIEKVDNLIYDKEPWQLWEVFGAYFHALRINAFLIIGKDTIKVSDLFKGKNLH